MTPLQILFGIDAVVTLFSAAMVVSTRRVMHAALWLVLTLFGVAVSFVMLEAAFFAVVQVVVYIGAIAILIIFAVMLTRQMMADSGPQVNRDWLLTMAASLVMLAALLAVMGTWDNFNKTAAALPAGAADLAALGTALVNPAGYALPFEVASVLLLAALIGAIFVAAERKGQA